MKAFFNWLDSCGKLGKTLIVLALILAAASTIKNVDVYDVPVFYVDVKYRLCFRKFCIHCCKKNQENSGISFEGESLYYHAYDLPILQSALSSYT